MSEIIRDLADKLMCPNASGFPLAEAHMLRNRMLDGSSEQPQTATGTETRT